MISIFQALREIGAFEGPDRTSPFQIRCPLHGADIHPSARVYPADNSMYCFTCHRAYSPLSLIATYHAIPMADAARLVAEKYGVRDRRPFRGKGRRLDDSLAQLVSCIIQLGSDQRRMQEADKLLSWAARGATASTILDEVDAMLLELWQDVVRPQAQIRHRTTITIGHQESPAEGPEGRRDGR